MSLSSLYNMLVHASTPVKIGILTVAGTAVYYAASKYFKTKKPCCTGGCGCGAPITTDDLVHGIVKDSYGKIGSKAELKNTESSNKIGGHFGYSNEELAALPEGANLGLQCGNPLTYAKLQPGEKVLDLGSGSGLDVFLASKAVGPTGKSVGLDMTPTMIERARKLAKQNGYKNVEFVLGEIEKMPLSDNTFDCILSNCVINLTSDKNAAFSNMFRVLAPGGRVAISDVLLKKQLPEELISAEGLCACISGCESLQVYKAGLAAAGFVEIEIVDKKIDLNVWKTSGGCSELGSTGCCGDSGSSCCNSSLSTFQGDFNDYIMSAIIKAKKPLYK